VITDVSFLGEGCAISKASGSMMTQAIKDKTIYEALALKELFIDLVTKDNFNEVEQLGKLKIFEGVKQFPVRVKCAALVWRALEAALESKSDNKQVTTE
jgi:nitrogen fixation NifU-like protein